MLAMTLNPCAQVEGALQKKLILTIFAFALGSCGTLGLAAREPALTHGVASGDVTASSAIVWSRADTEATMIVEYQPQADGGEPFRISTPNSSEADFTAQVKLESLQPDTTYIYNVWFENPKGASKPETGRFHTAPGTNDRSDVTLIWAGDLGGQGYCRQVSEGYRIFRSMRAFRPSFFIATGDMINADSICEEKGPQDNWINIEGAFPSIASPEVDWENRDQVDEVYSAHWRYNRSDPHFQDFLRSTSMYVQWDDHEVINDFGAAWLWQHADPERLGYPTIVESGREQLDNYHPLQTTSGEMYRSVQWGEALELFLLDTRSYRSENYLEDSPESAKTLLGSEQLEWLKNALADSRATWKIVSAGIPLSVPTGAEVEVLGHDSWSNGLGQGLASKTGFERELLELLTTLDQRNVKNIIFLAADTHFPAQIRYEMDLDGDADTLLIHELISGPLSSGLESPPDALDPTLSPEVLYSEGNVFNFGTLSVEFDSLGVPRIRADIRDESGRVRPGSILELSPLGS